MTDYKPIHGSTDDKLSRAKGYLIERGIYRGKANCLHRYTTSDGKRVVPSQFNNLRNRT